MSQENVELVRQALEAFRRRDNEAALRFYHSEIELHGVLDKHGVYRGLDGVRSYWQDQFGVMELLYEPNEWIDVGDHVVAVMRVRGRGKKSGASFESEHATVCT